MTGRAGAASFGDVTGEYLAIRREAAFITGWHELVWVRGPDALRFLEGLLSQAIEPIPVGGSADALLLSPQGKLRAPHRLLRGEGEIGLIADAGTAETITADLHRFKIRVDATIEIEQATVIDVWGPGSAGVVETVVALPAPATGWLRVPDGAVVVAMPLRSGGLQRFVVVGHDPEDFATAGVMRAGRFAVDAVRIEAGEPVMGVDIDEGTIPQEAGLVESAVDFSKGCYLGQELVARIDSRGHVNRHLRGVRIGANVLPPAGAELLVSGKVVGTLTSVAESLELRAPIGLALVRREVEPGAAVSVKWDGGDVRATVETLPMYAD